MTPKRIALALCALALVLAPGCVEPEPDLADTVEPPPDLAAQAVAEVQAASDAWAMAAADRDPEAFAAFFADDAVILYEQAPDVVGIDAIRADTERMMADPGFDLAFAADRIEAATSGDLAWEHGTWSMTLTGPEGEPTTVDGTYVSVWRKQPDGTWRCVADVPVSGP